MVVSLAHRDAIRSSHGAAKPETLVCHGRGILSRSDDLGRHESSSHLDIAEKEFQEELLEIVQTEGIDYIVPTCEEVAHVSRSKQIVSRFFAFSNRRGGTICILLVAN